MKEQIKKIVPDIISTNEKPDDLNMKVKPGQDAAQTQQDTYYNKEKSNGTWEEEYDDERDVYYNSRNNGRRWNNYRGRSQTNRRGFNNQRYNGNRSQNTNRKLNPPDANGNPSRCAICESVYHWARKCPDSQDTGYTGSKQTGSKSITLFQKIPDGVIPGNNDEMKRFVGEQLY